MASQQQGVRGVTIFYLVQLCLSFLSDQHIEQEYPLLRVVLRFERRRRVRDQYLLFLPMQKSFPGWFLPQMFLSKYMFLP